MIAKIVITLSFQFFGSVLSKSVSEGNLQVEITKEVNCKENQKARLGDKVTVHYGGFLQDGKYIVSNILEPFRVCKFLQH